MEKSTLLASLSAFISQRPGLEFANYGDRSAYFAEVRSITKDLHHARELLNAVSMRDSVTAEMILDAAKRAFSGRLTITQDGDKVKIDYCTGQYFPTEYRKSVCAVLAASLWVFWRDCGYDTGDKIYKQAKGEFSSALLKRYFF